MKLWKQLLTFLQIEAARLRIEWVSAAEGTRFAAVVSDFTAQLGKLRPLWDVEEDEKKVLKLNLAAGKKALPYIKLVEMNKLSVLSGSDERNNGSENPSEAQKAILQEIADKVNLSRIRLILEERQYSLAEIANLLRLSLGEVARLLGAGVTMGLVRWEPTGFVALERVCNGR